MEIGVYTTFTDQSVRPDVMATLVESVGFEVLATGEHTHVPQAAVAQAPGGGLTSEHLRTLDLFVALAVAAQATRDLRLSSAIIQLAHRDPIVTAKEAATVDFLSGGRLDLIVGHGWSEIETRHHGVDFDGRYAVVRERMLAIREIWRSDLASFHGEHVAFDQIFSWPKPSPPEGVRLILGGNSPGSEERALDYGDGWAVWGGGGVPERVAAFTAANPDVPVVVPLKSSDPRLIEQYAAAGTTRLLLSMGYFTARGDAERALTDLRSCVEVAVG